VTGRLLAKPIISVASPVLVFATSNYGAMIGRYPSAPLDSCFCLEERDTLLRDRRRADVSNFIPLFSTFLSDASAFVVF